MALTQEQIDILKAKIAELYIDIGDLNLAKAEVYPLDDLDDIDGINNSQYYAYNEEILCYEGEKKHLLGKYPISTELITPTDIDDAAKGNGRLFPVERGEILPYRDTGKSDGTVYVVDDESTFASVVPGQILNCQTQGTFVIVSVVNDHTLEVNAVVPLDPSLEYDIFENLIGSPYLFLRPRLCVGMIGGAGWNTVNENENIAIEQPLLSWFYWPIPPETLPGPIPNPAYDTYVENVDKFAVALDSEIASLEGELNAWSDGGGGWKFNFDTTQAYADINTALANAQLFKTNMDLTGDNQITIDDFKHANASTVMPPLLSARDTFISGTRIAQVSARETEIDTALGSITPSGESFTGSGLYYNRFNYLSMMVDRANGTTTAIASREVDTTALDDQIAFKERQIDEYESLL